MSGSNKFNLIQRYPLHIHITTLFLLLILLVGTIAEIVCHTGRAVGSPMP